MTAWAVVALFAACASAAIVPVDISQVKAGPVTVKAAEDSVTVTWPDGRQRSWQAEFTLDSTKPLIAAVRVGGKVIVERAQPLYRVETGKRRGGWDQFFDYPPSHPDGTRRHEGKFTLRSAKARTVGNRVELYFDGLEMGIFRGGIAYTFYPGGRLIQQEAVVRTSDPDVAFFYDAGVRMPAERDRRPGRMMASEIAYYDTAGNFRKVDMALEGSERHPEQVRYRTMAARMGTGAVAVFPLPHRYFMPRDYTTNMGYLWHTAWRGQVSLGIRQLPDDNSPFYPWMNAPPDTEQRLGMFLLVDDRGTREVIDDVLRYTNRDRFPALDGYKRLAVHWHFSYTDQAIANGLQWTPPFKPVLKEMGVDAAMIADFHGDGHPQDMTELRFEEIDAYNKACRAQSDRDFLLIPSEEANVHFGGHWVVAFPKPVFWHMKGLANHAFREPHPKYGTVYHIADSAQLLGMIRENDGWVYQSHPRTKGSMGYPDKIRETEHFRDPRYFGAGWKAMNSDLSIPRLGTRSLDLLDDMNDWGLKKRIVNEVDVFQIDSTHELYAHMNINYVKMARLPEWERYGEFMTAMQKGDFFMSTGEVLLPSAEIKEEGGKIVVHAEVSHTFPLAFYEIVFGTDAGPKRQIIPMDSTSEFQKTRIDYTLDVKGWKWARLAVWDVAANGAMVNPVWRD
ncbi:MAG: hypothetical protein HY820_11470 [Acidobacteria bacterium]|nr:hypothetical protein [Acidobacteriota bacterium]